MAEVVFYFFNQSGDILTGETPEAFFRGHHEAYGYKFCTRSSQGKWVPDGELLVNVYGEYRSLHSHGTPSFGLHPRPTGHINPLKARMAQQIFSGSVEKFEEGERSLKELLGPRYRGNL